VLVNNAGIACVKPFDEITLDQWRETLAVNILAPVLLTQRLLRLMPKGASVVNILSIAAKEGIPHWSSYCLSKFALEGLSQSLREELRPRGIRVITVYPSATDTNIWNSVPGTWPRDKMLKPEQVAEAVDFALTRPADVLVDTITVGNVAGKL
jgi:NAD(P)-dependent dehydrogenase (short-subunit alcohol dehydrogenase family)